MFAQSVPSGCPADRPVDDIIAEVRKEQSKRKHRNADPSPTIHCSWGWCIDVSKTPPTFPEPAPRVRSTDNQNMNSNTTGSNTVPVETCGTAMKRALEAAHNVDVGDQYFGQKNYNGALMRYKEALEEKPGDVAIHVRLGRVHEKLGQLSQAIEAYNAAQKLPRTEKWTDEAKSALLRLQHTTGS
jgi:Tetratricopeptide repeat